MANSVVIQLRQRLLVVPGFNINEAILSGSPELLGNTSFL